MREYREDGMNSCGSESEEEVEERSSRTEGLEECEVAFNQELACCSRNGRQHDGSDDIERPLVQRNCCATGWRI